MQPISVFAATTSRLHADLFVIRLRRAGISREKISAVFPEQSKPNCALCWLDDHSKPKLYSGETVTIAGSLAKRVSTQSEPTFIHSLQQVGLSLNDACAFAERLSKGQILVSVSTDDASEIAISWHTFRELEAEGIALGLSAQPESGLALQNQSATQHSPTPTPRSADDLSLGVAV